MTNCECGHRKGLHDFTGCSRCGITRCPKFVEEIVIPGAGNKK